MEDGPPDLIAINHDDYSAKYIGRTGDGRQFILTTPFEPAIRGAGAEFLALYLFDDAGTLLDAKIENLGPRATMDEDRRERLRDQWLAELGDVSYERVEVAPFSVKRFGTEFGLSGSRKTRTTPGPSRCSRGITWRSSSRGTAATTTPDGRPASR